METIHLPGHVQEQDGCHLKALIFLHINLVIHYLDNSLDQPQFDKNRKFKAKIIIFLYSKYLGL